MIRQTFNKSAPASAVLRLMDADYEYTEAVNIASVIYGISKKVVEKQLEEFV